MTPQQTKRTIEGLANQNATRQFKNLVGMRGIVCGALDRWLNDGVTKGIGEERRHKLLDYLFPTCGGSSKNLTGAQMAGLLEWMELNQSLTGQYEDSASAPSKIQSALECVREYELQHGQQELGF